MGMGSTIRPTTNFQNLAQSPLPSVPGQLALVRAGERGISQGCRHHLEGVLGAAGPGIISLNTICRDLTNTSDTSAFLLGTLQLLPAPASQLLRHHSHFLASPVGYLYERGDR